MISYLCSAERGVLSGSQASPGGCRGYQYYPIPLLAPAPTKPAAPRPAWPTLRLRQCASIPSKDPAAFECVRACICACVCVCACLWERVRVHLGTVISAAAPWCLMGQLWDWMHELEEMLPIFLRAPGVNLDEGVKQVLSVGALQPIRDTDIHVQGFRGVSNESPLFAIKLAP